MKRAWLLGLITVLASASAWAEEVATTVVAAGGTGLVGLGVGLAIGLAALGGSYGQGRVGSAAMEGIARNPQAQKTMFVSMILTLVLIESLSIYALVVSILMMGKM